MIIINQYTQSPAYFKTICLFSPHHGWQTNFHCYYCRHSCHINLSNCQLNEHIQCPLLRPQEQSHGVKLGVCWKLRTGPHRANHQPGKLCMQHSLPWHGKTASKCYVQQAMLITPYYNENWHILPLGEATCNDPYCPCCSIFFSHTLCIC